MVKGPSRGSGHRGHCENLLRDTAPAWPRRHVNTPLENNFSNIFLSTTRNFPAEFSCLAAAGLGWAGLGWAGADYSWVKVIMLSLSGLESTTISTDIHPPLAILSYTP